MIVAIQAIWVARAEATEYRLGAGRTGLPEALAFPQIAVTENPSEHVFVLHQIRNITSLDGASELTKIRPFGSVFHHGRIRIYPPDDPSGVRVMYQGQEATPTGKEPAFTLCLHEWGRVRYDLSRDILRFRFCEQWILNIGVCTELRPNIFLDSKPSVTYTRLEQM